MNKLIELVKNGYNYRRLLGKCKKHSPESNAYRLGKFYKDEIEKLESEEVDSAHLDPLIESAQEALKFNQTSEQTTEMIESVITFLTTLKRFEKHVKA